MSAETIRHAHEAMRARTDARLEDLEFLLDQGEHPERAVARVGWSMSAVRRVLARRGRQDLAARLREAGPA